ncbi:MAG: 3',5'-cyclic-nucleotide phosphodiesterase [Deltaproteobacteria bacterium]|nr:3',5'-cyclic-nucleotide phosphodiesterase [Deltaproteobacteria bacterium]
MKVDILGCYGNVVGPYRATSFLINDSILLDAGTVTEVLTDERIRNIKAAFITHPHIDHVKGLFSLIDEMVALREDGIEIFAAKQVKDIITENLFNNLIWPDFTSIPSAERALIKPNEIELEEEVEVVGINFKPILMNHSVYTTGFVVKESEKGFMFTSDTGETERFWEIARKEDGIEFIIADVSFPESQKNIAQISGHMTLSTLLHSIDRYGLRDIPVYIYHMKPFFIEEIRKEVANSKRKNLFFLDQGTSLFI